MFRFFFLHLKKSNVIDFNENPFRTLVYQQTLGSTLNKTLIQGRVAVAAAVNMVF